jgi:hypothetical protein
VKITRTEFESALGNYFEEAGPDTRAACYAAIDGWAAEVARLVLLGRGGESIATVARWWAAILTRLVEGKDPHGPSVSWPAHPLGLRLEVFSYMSERAVPLEVRHRRDVLRAAICAGEVSPFLGLALERFCGAGDLDTVLDLNVTYTSVLPALRFIVATGRRIRSTDLLRKAISGPCNTQHREALLTLLFEQGADPSAAVLSLIGSPVLMQALKAQILSAAQS